MTPSVWLQTCLIILAADFARALLHLITLLSQEGAGKAGCRPRTRGPLREDVAQENRTAAYRWCQSLGLPCAMVGRLMPCSPGSRVPSGLPRLANWMMQSARLGSLAPSRRLDRSNDGQDHTVLPYAAHPASPRGFAGLRRRSSARGFGLTGTTRPARTISRTTLPRPPQPGSRIVTTRDRPSRMSRDGPHIRRFRILVKWNILIRID